MARPYHLPPSAASLMASMRDLGYSLETAVADLIDNSITAEATDVQIYCDLSGVEPTLVIADNGRGMTEQQVIAAMRHGTSSPHFQRAANDLGRFGLGLKTASFSQCRSLTVVSKQNGQGAGAEWDLDRVKRSDDWFIAVLDNDEVVRQPLFETLGDSGTLIVWRHLDRLFEGESGPKRQEIVNEKLETVERHLSLVFHRYLSGEVKGRKLSIRINGHPVVPFDPFCRRNPATQVLPEETVWINDVAVTMQPYILPHHSRLTIREYDYYQDRSDFISNQGTYVYRNGRLMAWGDWFRLVPKGESTKLARVQIDFPSILDEAWTIDIKKSRARPPNGVRERLRQIVQKIVARSVIVHRGRGQRLFNEVQAPLWERYADHGGIRFAVNMQHPLIQSLYDKLGDVEGRSLKLLLDSIAASLPIEMIYSDYSTSPREVNQEDDDVRSIERLNALRDVLFGDRPIDHDSFLQVVVSTRLFENQMDLVRQYIAEVDK
jgi:hypothetical protein